MNRIHINIKYSTYKSWSSNDQMKFICDILHNLQKDKCAICEQPLFCPGYNRGKIPFQEQPVVDHDHNTDEIRGVVHSRCNIAISTLENYDNEWIKKAKDYLSDNDTVRNEQFLQVSFAPSPIENKIGSLNFDYLKKALLMTNSIVVLNRLKNEFHNFNPTQQDELMRVYDESHKQWERPKGTVRLVFGNIPIYFKDFIPYVVPEFSGRIEPDFWITGGIMDAVSWARNIQAMSDIILDERTEKLMGLPEYELK